MNISSLRFQGNRLSRLACLLRFVRITGFIYLLAVSTVFAYAQQRSLTLPSRQTAPVENQILVAYWPHWAEVTPERLQAIPAQTLDYLVYAFAQPVQDPRTGKVTLLFPDTLTAWQQIVTATGAKPLLSIGGWGLSADFSDLTATPEQRARFADAIIDQMLRNEFQGVDLDWEFPVEGGAERQVHRPNDHDSLLELVRLLRKRLDRLENHNGQPYRLTVAISGDPHAQSTRYRLGEMAPYVDWFHLMAYDFAGSWIRVTAHTAALYPYKTPNNANRVFTVSESVQSALQLGIPANKLVLGINLAGKRFEGVRASRYSPLSQPYGKIDEQAEIAGLNDFSQLQKLLEPAFADDLNDDFLLGWDAEAQAAYLYAVRQQVFISFENQRSILAKMKFTRQKRLKGMMIWSLDKDGHSFPIVHAIREFKNRPLPE